MKPNDYILDSSVNSDRSVCTLGLVPNSEDFWLFGDSFLRGYYSVFNMNAGTLGLAPHVTSDKTNLIPGTVPENYLSGGTSVLVWTISGIVIAIVAYFFITFI